MVVHVCVSNNWVGLLVNMQVFWVLKEVLDMQLPRQKKCRSTNNMRLLPSPSPQWVLHMLTMISSLGFHTKQRSLHSCLAGLHAKHAAIMISLNKYDTIETFSFLLWPKTSMLVLPSWAGGLMRNENLDSLIGKQGLRSRDYDTAFWIQHWQDAEAVCRLVDEMYKAAKRHTHEVSGSPLSCVFLKGLAFVEMTGDGSFWVFNIRREQRASMSIRKSLILWRGPVGNIRVEPCVSFQVWLTEHKASAQPSTVTTIIIW